MPSRNDEAEELDGREWPAGNEADELDPESETVSCPICRTPVYEDAEHCPNCGNYVLLDESEVSRKPWWLITGVILSLIVVAYWLWPG